MDHPIGRAVAEGGRCAQGGARDLAPAAPAQDTDRLRRDHDRGETGGKPEVHQDPGGVRRELNAGAGLLEPVRLLEHDCAEAAPDQRQRAGKAADAGPRNDHGA